METKKWNEAHLFFIKRFKSSSDFYSKKPYMPWYRRPKGKKQISDMNIW